MPGREESVFLVLFFSKGVVLSGKRWNAAQDSEQVLWIYFPLYKQ